jgi:hypothetical protein
MYNRDYKIFQLKYKEEVIKMKKKHQSVLDTNYDEARKFFMKEENYCSLQLPEYFSFKQVLAQAEKKLRQKNQHHMILIKLVTYRLIKIVKKIFKK